MNDALHYELMRLKQRLKKKVFACAMPFHVHHSWLSQSVWPACNGHASGGTFFKVRGSS
jgi:hypothetical protein